MKIVMGELIIEGGVMSSEYSAGKPYPSFVSLTLLLILHTHNNIVCDKNTYFMHGPWKLLPQDTHC